MQVKVKEYDIYECLTLSLTLHMGEEEYMWCQMA